MSVVSSFDPDDDQPTCPGPDECLDDLCRGQDEGLCGKLSDRVRGADDGWDDYGYVDDEDYLW